MKRYFRWAPGVRALYSATVNVGTSPWPRRSRSPDDAWCSAFTPSPDVIEVVDRHRGDRVLALFTNNGPLEEEALRRRYPDVFARFGEVCFSHRLGRRKPEPAAYAAVADLLHTPGDGIVFIDDSPANVTAARAAALARRGR